jgi:hypothetical protein
MNKPLHALCQRFVLRSKFGFTSVSTHLPCKGGAHILFTRRVPIIKRHRAAGTMKINLIASTAESGLFSCPELQYSPTLPLHIIFHRHSQTYCRVQFLRLSLMRIAASWLRIWNVYPRLSFSTASCRFSTTTAVRQSRPDMTLLEADTRQGGASSSQQSVRKRVLLRVLT